MSGQKQTPKKAPQPKRFMSNQVSVQSSKLTAGNLNIKLLSEKHQSGAKRIFEILNSSLMTKIRASFETVRGFTRDCQIAVNMQNSEGAIIQKKGYMEIIKLTPRKPSGLKPNGREPLSSVQVHELSSQRRFESGLAEMRQLQFDQETFKLSATKSLVSAVDTKALWHEWFTLVDGLGLSNWRHELQHQMGKEELFEIRSNFVNEEDDLRQDLNKLTQWIKRVTERVSGERTAHRHVQPTELEASLLPAFTLTAQKVKSIESNLSKNLAVLRLVGCLDKHLLQHRLALVQGLFRVGTTISFQGCDSRAGGLVGLPSARNHCFGESRRTSETRVCDPSLLSINSFPDMGMFGQNHHSPSIKKYSLLLGTTSRLFQTRVRDTFSLLCWEAQIRNEITLRLLAKRRLTVRNLVLRLRLKQSQVLSKLSRVTLASSALKLRQLMLKLGFSTIQQLFDKLCLKRVWKHLSGRVPLELTFSRSMSGPMFLRASSNVESLAELVNDWEIKIIRKWTCGSHLDRNIAFWRIRAP